MSVEINWIGVISAVVVSMIIGAVWYSKNVFGVVWAKLAGLNDQQLKKNMFGPMALTVVGSLMTAYILAYTAFLAHAFFKNSFFMDTVEMSFWLWFGIAATTLFIHNSFEHKPWKLTAMAIGNRFVTLLAMGIAIGLFKP